MMRLKAPHFIALELIIVVLCQLFPRVVPFQTAAFVDKSRPTRGNIFPTYAQRAMDPASLPSDSTTPCLERKKLSLVDSFLVEINQEEDGTNAWSLISVDDALGTNCDTEETLSSGAKSWKALHSNYPQQSASSEISLRSLILGNKIEIQITSSVPSVLTEHAKLISVMARVMAQYTANNATENSRPHKTWDLIISSQSEKEEIFGVTFSIDDIPGLFGTDSSVEIVDMVDRVGKIIGMVPRNLVHSLNILHRGIGLTVSKDAAFSELYVHRRTDFKRIFPSLYDMFVGGVSLSGEDSKLTAAREVAEELGLSRALDESLSTLSDPLFKCVVCTSYNRCVVTVFQYTMDPSVETISWQEEEVSWGDFVPYDTVEAAADLSIQRLVAKNEWPGILPAVQSKWKGKKPPGATTCGMASEDWTTWDFVPDGLLVWEAWLKWRQAV